MPDSKPQPAAAVEAESLPASQSVNPYLLERASVPAAAAQRFAQARSALAAENWSQAEQDLLWLKENFPQFSGPFINLALLYQQTGQLDKVSPAFQQAIVANRQNVYAYNQWAIFQREQGNFAEAEQLYLQALEVWADYPEGHLNLAILYDMYLGKLDAALQHYQQYQALQEQPDKQVSGWIIDTERRWNKYQQSTLANQ